MNTQSTTKQPSKESHWQGSLKTAVLIRRQIAERWGEEESGRYLKGVCLFYYLQVEKQQERGN